jgi:hypothetical protein
MKAGTTVRAQSAQEEGMRGGNNKLAAGGAVTPPAVGNNRGVSTIELSIYTALAGIILAAVVVAQHWLAGYAQEHYERGSDAKQLEWDKSKDLAAEAQRRKDVAVAQALLAEEKRTARGRGPGARDERQMGGRSP